MSGSSKMIAGIGHLAERVLPLIDSKTGPAAAAALAALQQLLLDASAIASEPRDVAALDGLRRKVDAQSDLTLARLRSGG